MSELSCFSLRVWTESSMPLLLDWDCKAPHLGAPAASEFSAIAGLPRPYPIQLRIPSLSFKDPIHIFRTAPRAGSRTPQSWGGFLSFCIPLPTIHVMLFYKTTWHISSCIYLVHLWRAEIPSSIFKFLVLGSVLGASIWCGCWEMGVEYWWAELKSFIGRERDFYYLLCTYFNPGDIRTLL